MLRKLYRASVWHPDAIPLEEWGSRQQRRVWIPLFDLVMLAAGVWAVVYGSPILHLLFSEDVIDTAGAALAVSAAVCLVGVVFPRLLILELVGKLVMLCLLGGYAFSVVAFRSNPDPSAGFICFILASAMILPLSRLGQVGEELKERREEMKGE